MPRVGKHGAHPGAGLGLFAVIHRAKMPHERVDILQRIKRRVTLLAGALGAPVLPDRLGLLNVGRIRQHDRAKIPGGSGGVNRA